MGIDISSKLMVGLDYTDLSNIIGSEKIDDLLDNEDLHYASPHYDSRRIHWFVGVELVNGLPIDDNVVITANEMKSVISGLDETLGVKLTYRLRACAHAY